MFASYDLMSYWWPDVVPMMSQRLLKSLLIPPRENVFSRLPAELLMEVMSYLGKGGKGLGDWMAFAMANYHVLRDKGIAPGMSRGTKKQLQKAFLRELVNPFTPSSPTTSTASESRSEASSMAPG